MVRENVAQVREILLQLDAAKTADFRRKLQRELGSKENDVGKLLAAFFQTDDANFRGRYDFFYKELAPSLELYRVRIGDVLTIKAFTRSGYVQSVNVPGLRDVPSSRGWRSRRWRARSTSWTWCRSASSTAS